MQQIQPWSFRVEPYVEESFSHYMGRFRRATHLRSSQISHSLGLEYPMVGLWETPSRRRRPNQQQMRSLSEMLRVDVDRLQSMWLPTDTPLHLPTRLCAHCYAENPYHKVTWQVAGDDQCDRHQQPLLTRCPHCGMAFAVPCHWDSGMCEQCGLPFQEMIDYSET